jgi:carbamoyltransferase
MITLGVHIGHDSSAALVVDGSIVAAVQEERFSRIKNDSSFPYNSINYCLSTLPNGPLDIDALAFANTFKNMPLEIFKYIEFPNNWVYNRFKLSSTKNFLLSLLKQKRFMGSISSTLPLYMDRFVFSPKCRFYFYGHHLAHAASAAYTAPFDVNEDALVCVMDGMGEGLSSSLWKLNSHRELMSLAQIPGGGSIGWFYGNATEALGWRHGSDEWKVMGLAPYGQVNLDPFRGLYPVYEGGDLKVPYDFSPHIATGDHGATHWHSDDSLKLRALLDQGMSREDFAASAQAIVEKQMLEFIVPHLERNTSTTIACAGGCFLNIKFNQTIWESGRISKQWIYPDCGDSGLSVGAALLATRQYKKNSGKESVARRALEHLFLGPAYDRSYVRRELEIRQIPFYCGDDAIQRVADALAKDLAVGWFQGRMESGPRALGNRSILMSPLSARNKDLINAKVKYREDFRPFCPSIAEKFASKYLESFREERYMTTAFKATEHARVRAPAVVHIDGTLRPQLVYEGSSPDYHRLIMLFAEITGEQILLNTSFNVKGEPIVRTPEEAIRCFFSTGLDLLYLEGFLIDKRGIVGQSH